CAVADPTMDLKTTLLTLSALLLLAPAVAADPPAGSTCVGGYNPTALSNVCTGTLATTPGNTGTVTTTPGPCVIGNICAPVPGYTPSGGTPLPSLGVPSVSYVSVYALVSGQGHIVFCSFPYYGDGALCEARGPQYRVDVGVDTESPAVYACVDVVIPNICV
ncbi:MAG TPA: hypothetical protein VM241_05640, partial [Candidatus Thermoplasmatota archaeon]|nr:hypothetical protein [Candidatus Thermoplasmatota archaeon]